MLRSPTRDVMLSERYAKMLAEAADREDAPVLRRILETLQNMGLNYFGCQKVFASAGISADRYEELCQLVDYQS